MSRSGYSDDVSESADNLFRGNLKRAIACNRGQRFLRELLSALDALPAKRLASSVFEDADGSVCALGALCRVKGVQMDGNYVLGTLSEELDVAPMLANEIMFTNDDDFARLGEETPEQRWTRMRKWAASRLSGGATA